MMSTKCRFIDYDYIIDSMYGIKKSVNVEPYHIPMLLTQLLNGKALYITPCTDGEKRHLHTETHIFETDKNGDIYYLADLVRSSFYLSKSIETRLMIAQKILDVKIVHYVQITDSLEKILDKFITYNQSMLYDDLSDKLMCVKPLLKISFNVTNVFGTSYDRMLDKITSFFDILLETKPKTLFPNSGWNVYMDNNDICIKFTPLNELYIDLQFIGGQLCAIDNNCSNITIFESKQILSDSEEMIEKSIYQCIPKISLGKQWIIDVKKIQHNIIKPMNLSEVNSIMQRIKMNWNSKQLIDVFKANDHIYYDSNFHKLTQDIQTKNVLNHMEENLKAIIDLIELKNSNILDLNIDDGSMGEYLIETKNVNKYCGIGINPITIGSNMYQSHKQHLIWGNVVKPWNNKIKIRGLEGLEYFSDYESLGLFQDINVIMLIDKLHNYDPHDVDKIRDLTSNSVKLIFYGMFSELIDKEIQENENKLFWIEKVIDSLDTYKFYFPWNDSNKIYEKRIMSSQQCIESFQRLGWKFIEKIPSVSTNSKYSCFTNVYSCLILEK